MEYTISGPINKLNAGYVNHFLSESTIADDKKEKCRTLIQTTYNDVIQPTRTKAFNENKLKFKCDTQCDDEIKAAFKIFETMGLKIVNKEIEEKTDIKIYAKEKPPLKLKADGEGTSPSMFSKQKFNATSNELDEWIYKVIEEGEFDCDDASYLRVYNAVKEMLSVARTYVMKSTYAGFNTYHFPERRYTDITTNIKPEDMPLLTAVVKDTGVYIDNTSHYKIQNICLKGSVNEPSLVGNNEKPLPSMPIKNKAKLNPESFSDFKFISGTTIISFHKVVLTKYEYFKNFIDPESKEVIEVSMHEVSPQALKELQNFLYKDKVSQECINNIDIALDTAKLAKQCMIDELEAIAKTAVYNKISPLNFFSVLNSAEKDNDPYLKKLCKWFTDNNRNLENTIDFTNNTPFQLFQFKGLLKQYGLESLNDVVHNELSKKLGLNEEFIKICTFVVDSNKEENTKILKSLLTKEFVDNLKANKAENKAVWKAYVNFKTECC